MTASSASSQTQRAGFVLPQRSAQAAIGLALAALIAVSWLSLHAFAMFVFELTWANWPAAVAIVAFQCWLSVGVFIVCHDAMHGNLAPGQHRLNAAIGTVLLFLYAGFRWKVMRGAHLEHHSLSGHAGDPDFDERNPTRFFAWYVTFFKRYFGWQSVIFVHAVVAVYWFVFDVPWLQIAVLYGVPAILSSFQLFYFGTFRPHHHVEEEGFVDSHNARSEEFGTLGSLATCFHFGYHLEHHHRPDVPWWALPGAKRAGVAQSFELQDADT